MRTAFISILTAFAAVAFVLGCQTEPKNEAAKANIQDDAQASLNRFQRSDPTLRDMLDRSPGYAVFPSVGKGGFIVGAGYGKGVVYERGRPVGYADISQASFGLQAGAQDYAELLVFHDQTSLDQFKKGSYGLSADATAIALKPGAAAGVNVKQGVSVFTVQNSGVMAEAAVAGQKFRYSATAADTGTAPKSDAGTTSGGQTTGNRSTFSTSGSVSTPSGGDTTTGTTGKVGASGSVSTQGGGDTTVNTDTPKK
jgi:lipid-binding SYLF domain-containing protein